VICPQCHKESNCLRTTEPICADCLARTSVCPDCAKRKKRNANIRSWAILIFVAPLMLIGIAFLTVVESVIVVWKKIWRKK